MNFKTTYILFGGLALLLLALLLVVWNNSGDAESTADLLFPSATKGKGKNKDKPFAASEVTKVVIERKRPAGEDLVLERDGKDWKITSPRQLRAESFRVTSMIDSILSARTDEMAKPKSLKDGELDSPSRVVSLQGDDRKLTLTIGAVDPGAAANAFVLSSDYPKKPLAVSKRSIEAALEDVPYFRAKEVFGDDTLDVVSVAVSDAAKGTVELAKEKDHWRFVKPAYGDAAVDQNWLRHLTDLKVDYKSEKENDFVQDGVADVTTIDKDLAKSDRLRIEVGRGADAKKATKTTLVVLTGKKLTDKGKDKDKDKDKDNKYYAYIDEAGKPKDVFKLSAKSLEPFVKLLDDPSSLRGKNLLALGPFAKPDAVDVQNNGLIGDAVLEFRRPEGAKGWTLYRKDGKAVPTDEKAAEALVSAISSPNAVTSFVDLQKTTKETLGLDRPGVVVKVWSNSLEDDKDKKDEKDEKDKKDKDKDKKDEKKDETAKPKFKKDVKVATELRFGKRDGAGHVAVERVWGGDSVVVMVPDTVLQQVEKNALAYYDKSIPPFAEGLADKDVTKVEFTRDGKQYEVTRAKEQDPWKFVKPEELKDRSANEPAVRAVLEAVNHLTVRELAAEKAGGDLERFGLKTPKNRVVVTVTKDGKDTKHEFDFGTEAQGKGVYAKVSGREPVYLVEDTLAAALKRELRDTTVFDFDADKVKAVKLVGWAELTGETVTRTLERKDGKWSVKEITKPIDEAKVRQEIEGLSHLKAVSFIAARALDQKKDDPLQIEVTLADDKKYQLTIGGAEGDNFYATSEQVKGEAFLVSKSLFEALKKSPKSFLK